MDFICETCGTQYGQIAAPPDRCMICEDERQYVGWDGQRWTSHKSLQQRLSIRIEPYRGMMALTTQPAFAIGQRALLLPTAAGNVLWEALPVVTDDAVARIREAGGLAMIAISHPHFYSAMAEWSAAFGNVPIYLNAADRDWVGRRDANIVYWGEGDRLVLGEGISLIRCGGHFDGSTILHWADGPTAGGALFSGDTLQVTQDRRRVSFMYSYPNLIPLDRRSVEVIRQRLSGLRFDDVYGYARERDIIGGGRAAVDWSFDSYLDVVG